MHWDGWWPMGGMWLFWLLVLAGLVLLVRWFLVGERGSAETHESPEQILKKRYARGDIDKEEYERMLSDLRR